MTLWLNRAGSRGENESKFLNDGRLYLTWEGLKHDLSIIASTPALGDLLRKVYVCILSVFLAQAAAWG